jgi:dihydrofolate reductase
MKISLIAAKAKNNVIGKNNRLLWYLPEDLKFFKEKTMGHFILMGRKTFESLDEKLTGRKIIVITSSKELKSNDAYQVCEDIYKGINEAYTKNETELFICGGESIYRQTIEFADCMYLTELEKDFEGDAYFPEFNIRNWKANTFKEFKKNETAPFAFKIREYVAINKKHDF